MREKIHIWPLSRVLAKPAINNWARYLKVLEAQRDQKASSYAPLRNAILRELKNPGEGHSLLEQGLAKLQRKGVATIRERSRKAFTSFCEMRRVQKLELSRTLYRSAENRKPVSYAGYQLEGGFLVELLDRNGKKKLVSFFCSEWTSEETKMYLELLAIVAEVRHGCTRKDVWLVDLGQPKPERHIPSPNFQKLRSSIESMLANFTTLQIGQDAQKQRVAKSKTGDGNYYQI